MSYYGNCKHGIYLGGCRKCFPLRHELTDEEILDTARTMPVIDGATMEEAYVLFARAILKKAKSK